ncbi:hypothetical protein [Mucilaginibacter lacusdianchii]|uniref:hypothetical protein n=1 Tax=Mucilaginibacter lacusdianchii TaxID=2684211 RepID=UPI00131C515B|nr:hypothetical protein [Mucilaginibacter sp. JXJ CY 39]
MRYLNLLLLSMLTACINTFAQENDYVGSYNGSKHELALQLYIMPQHNFVIAMSYGAVDQVIIGKWERKGDGIYLKQDTPPQSDPFLVYQRKAGANENEFIFRNFGMNTTVAFRVLNKFNADSLKYLHLPGENIFTRSSTLQVPANKLGSIFISRQIAEGRHEIYQYNLAPGYNAALLYYNPAPNQQLFESQAVLKDGVLYLINADGNQQATGHKSPLPDSYERQLAELKKSTAVPDSLDQLQNGVYQTYYRLKPTQHFESNLKLNTATAYFKSKEEELKQDVIATPVPTLHITPADTKKKRSSTKKPAH